MTRCGVDDALRILIGVVLAGLAMSPTASFGRGQLLFLLVTWVPVLGAFTQALPSLSRRGVFFVHASFWISASLASLLVVSLSPEGASLRAEPRAASAVSWRLGRGLGIAIFLTPIILYCTARLTVASHREPRPGSALRFAETFSRN